MPCGRKRKIWLRVPDGSILKLGLAPSDSDYTQRICVKIDGGPLTGCDEEWGRNDVTPGPMTYRLQAPHRYDIEILIAFIGEQETTVEIHAEIRKPDGSLHGEAFQTVHSGTRGQSCETRLVILTAE